MVLLKESPPDPERKSAFATFRNEKPVVVQVYADFATRLSLNFLTLMPLIPCIGFAGTPWAVFADAAH